MRTDNPMSATVAAQIRTRVQQVRRAVRANPWRLAAVVSALAGSVALVTVAYLALTQSPTTAYLRSGQPFSPADVHKITKALEAKNLSWRKDDQGRIAVESDHLAEAKDVLARLDLGPRDPYDEREKGSVPSIIDGPGEREQRLHLAHEKTLASMIAKLDGVISAFVQINRPKPPRTLRSAPPVTVFVWLETEGGRELGFRTVQSIQNIIIGSEPEVKHDAVTLIDRTGRHYLDANDPKVAEQNKLRASEEALGQKVLDELEHIHGVRVTVQKVPAPTSSPTPLPSAAVAPAVAPTDPGAPPVAVNQPLELEPEPEPAAPVVQPPPVAPPRPARVRVLVKVPRSYYLKAFPSHSPTADELRQSRERTERSITLAVEHVVPPGESTEVSIDTFPDEVTVTAPPPPVPPRAADARRPPWWAAAGVLGPFVLLLLIVGSRRLATRRALRPVPASVAMPGRFQVDEPSGAGPTERVRELIRLNPEAAASILQRWTGQGGHHG